MNEYNDIRDILNRWYDGTSTPAEQQRLAEFFAEDRELPADLAMERELFRAMAEAGEEYAEMPADVSECINLALEAEIAGDGTGKMAGEKKPQRKAFSWRRGVIAACSAAACLILALAIHFFTFNDSQQGDSPVQMAVTQPSQPSQSSQSSQSSQPSLASQSSHTIIAHAGAEPSCSEPKARPSSRGMKAKKPAPARPSLDEQEVLYLSPEEEERLAAANYHVVTDEREANAILGAVFVRLESGMTEEGYRISDVSARYEMEMNDIYDL